MPKVKPIKCPKGAKPFDGCGTICIEVGHSIGYPRGIFDDPKREYHEYRFVCPKCGKEWIYDTFDKGIAMIPKTSQFKIRLINGKEVIRANPKNPYFHESIKFLKKISKTERKRRCSRRTI